MVIAVAVLKVSHAGMPTWWDLASSARRLRMGWRVDGFGVV